MVHAEMLVSIHSNILIPTYVSFFYKISHHLSNKQLNIFHWFFLGAIATRMFLNENTRRTQTRWMNSFLIPIHMCEAQKQYNLQRILYTFRRIDMFTTSSDKHIVTNWWRLEPHFIRNCASRNGLIHQQMVQCQNIVSINVFLSIYISTYLPSLHLKSIMSI